MPSSEVEALEGPALEDSAFEPLEPSLAGFALLRQAPSELVAGVQAFAAGALLTMIADSMMPQAFAMNGRTAGLLTTLGFGLAYAIGALAQSP